MTTPFIPKAQFERMVNIQLFQSLKAGVPTPQVNTNVSLIMGQLNQAFRNNNNFPGV